MGWLKVCSVFSDGGYRLAGGQVKAAGFTAVLADRVAGYFDYSRCADETASSDPLMLHEILAQSGVAAPCADGERLFAFDFI
jgi:hypothetical protein